MATSDIAGYDLLQNRTNIAPPPRKKTKKNLRFVTKIIWIHITNVYICIGKIFLSSAHPERYRRLKDT